MFFNCLAVLQGEYVFRVSAGNNIGIGEPSDELVVVRFKLAVGTLSLHLSVTLMRTRFSLVLRNDRAYLLTHVCSTRSKWMIWRRRPRKRARRLKKRPRSCENAHATICSRFVCRFRSLS